MPARRESRTSSSPALLDESEWIDFSEVGRLKDFQPPSSGGAPLSVNSLNFSQFCFQKPVYQWYVDLSRSQKSKLITTQKITDVCGARHRGFQCDLQRILRPTQRCSDRSKRRRLVVFEHLASSAVTEDQRTNPSIQVLLVLNFMTAFIPKSFGWVYPCWVFVEYEGTSAWTSRKTKNTKTSKSQKKSSKAYRSTRPSDPCHVCYKEKLKQSCASAAGTSTLAACCFAGCHDILLAQMPQYEDRMW